MSKVYIKTDKNQNVIAINSDIFLESLDGWTFLEEGTGDKYDHAHGCYFTNGLIDENNAYRYKIVNGKLTAVSGE